SKLEAGKPYSDYIEWLKSKDLEDAKTYWKSNLEKIVQPTKVPFGTENTSRETVKQELRFTLDKTRTGYMKELAKHHRVSLNTILQSIWAILLHKYGKNNDIVYGYVVSGRNPDLEGVENILGLFINTIPLSVSMKEDTPFIELVQAIRNRILKNTQY